MEGSDCRPILTRAVPFGAAGESAAKSSADDKIATIGLEQSDWDDPVGEDEPEKISVEELRLEDLSPGVGQLPITDLEKRRKSMNDSASAAHNVLNKPAFLDQGIGDQRAMAPPRHCLRAENGRAVVRRNLHELLKPVAKLLACHIVGIAAEGGIRPAEVD